MLAQSHMTTILPVVEVDRARRFYEDTLGFRPAGGHQDGSYWLRGEDGGTLALLPRPDREKSKYTALSFEVKDIDRQIRDLEARGVRFEDYDLPELKTVNHVFRAENEICAWFTDTEGNILCLHEEVSRAQ